MIYGLVSPQLVCVPVRGYVPGNKVMLRQCVTPGVVEWIYKCGCSKVQVHAVTTVIASPASLL